MAFRTLEKGLPPATVTRRQNYPLVIAYLILLSVAVTLFSTPWSLLRSGISRRVLLKASSDWQDNIWPIRQQNPWDISTDFPHPRTLEYDVQEGTWLRLDVHPTSGDIVFDMVGDLYCLPGSQALRQEGPDSRPVKALPILTGIPHDSDPHFSPNGDRLVFRSDAELGVENIWVMEWKGCENMDVRPVANGREDLTRALKNKTAEEMSLADGLPEDPQQRTNRLLREGRLNGMSADPFMPFQYLTSL